MGKYTPGPWVADDGDGGDWAVFIDTTGGMLATLYNGEREYQPQAEANARLIAAAPDLLAALKRAQSMLQRLAEEAEGGPRSRIAALHEVLKQNAFAIAKAAGESTP